MSNRIYTVFVQNVRDRMATLRINQSKLAEALGVTEGYVSQILNGHRRPGLDSLESFADALSIDPSELIRAHENTTPEKVAKSA